MATLIVFAGLPGSGKSSIARALAREIGAVWLRIDSIEQAIRDSSVAPGSIDDAGYRVAYAVAEDNLRLGLDVIGDSVNDCLLTRNAWRQAGLRAGAQVVEVETLCTDLKEHRRRIETRNSEVPGLVLPDWQATIGREYEQWDRDHLTIDTAGRSVEDCTKLVREVLAPGARVDTFETTISGRENEGFPEDKQRRACRP
jgi:predicted kinase